MSKIPELMSGRKLEHSANIIGNITTQRGVVAATAAKVGGQILSAQSIALTATLDTAISSVELPASPATGLPGTLTAGTILRVTVIGRNSNSAGATNLTLNVKIGATSGGLAGATTVATFVGDPSPNHYVYLTSEIHVVTAGGSGAVLAANRSFVNGTGGTPIAEATTFGGASVSTLVSNTLYISGSWAAGGETLSVNDISVEIVGG
jgi:hypothetical protein